MYVCCTGRYGIVWYGGFLVVLDEINVMIWGARAEALDHYYPSMLHTTNMYVCMYGVT